MKTPVPENVSAHAELFTMTARSAFTVDASRHERADRSVATRRALGGCESAGGVGNFVKKVQEAKNVQDHVQNETGKRQEDRRLIRARQRAIGRELRRFYDGVAEEPVPDEFYDLLKQIDAKTDKDGKGSDES